jgi:outer membrane protein
MHCASQRLMRKARTTEIVFALAVIVWGSLCCYGQAPFPGSTTRITLLEAIQSTLENHPLLRSQQVQVDITRGLREQASGAFDQVMQSSLNNSLNTTPLTQAQQLTNLEDGLLGGSQKLHATNFGLSTDQLFRNGIEVTSGVQTIRNVDNLFLASGVNSSTISLNIRIPLLRGRGYKATGAQEDAAKTEVDATIFDLRQLVSQLTSNAATSYWNLVAARTNLTIAIDAEERGKIYRQNVQELIKADRVPRNDRNEVVANAAQRSSNRLVAEQQLVSAEQQLALDMGEDADGIAKAALEPEDSLPDGENQELPSDSTESIRYYIEQALHNRADYRASRMRAAEQGILFGAARNRLLPQLDLSAFGGYAGLQEGLSVGDFYSDSYQGIRGPTAGAGLTYSFPRRNQAAHGAMLQAQGLKRQAELQTVELERTISSGVIVALEAVRSAIIRLKHAREAVESFQDALAGERDKYSGGIGSIVDILTVEDKLNGALSDQLQAELNYALALVQFRFATGTLTPADASAQNVTAHRFVSLPFLKAPEENQ